MVLIPGVYYNTPLVQLYRTWPRC